MALAQSLYQFYSLPGPNTELTLFQQDTKPVNGIEALCDLVNNIVLIDFWHNMRITKLNPSRESDLSLRSIHEKLANFHKLNTSDLQQERVDQEKILGNCRDTSLLLCAFLRYHGVPARVRSGFATFFSKKKKFDHWLCEYWQEEEQRWVKVDTWMYQIICNKHRLNFIFRFLLNRLKYNPLDVESKDFISGGEAWLNCYIKGENPKHYGTYEKELNGDWFVRDNMLRDLFCLNKLEILPWDTEEIQGGKDKPVEDEDVNELNQLAELVSTPDQHFADISAYFKTHFPGIEI
ncbi:transglutaminase-like domain-containing protein [Teredinibacter sp. KSP-S5-2]|uniref:transglutaminase-like domain-containing protein n=1 Tax=Teredinibacter sp. KSP-S5-2 TaxID=3034506 RepID=UPI002934955F|nr:transglutaminase-like domain-containing protein [Teredinibacter sp. KSP-S5-2]WNO09174.1 transglutaminase-like domain-containing protein [Teredinibacter sp. KSP-S5-2]